MVSRHTNRFDHGAAQGPASFLKAGWRAAFWGVAGFGFVTMIGCSPLEPMVEPEVSDLQLTVDTLKTTVRDAQRTIAELRAELDARRQELADVQIARAQLEGRVREAERRLVEARQVIDLQREELVGSRSERERVSRTGAVLQNQLKQLQKQLSKMGKQANETRGTGMAPASLPSQGRRTGLPPPKSDQSEILEENARIVTTPAVHRPKRTSVSDVQVSTTVPERVSVKPGDTLWSIAQRYRVPVKRLMAINQLPDTHIQVGQALWLSEPAAADEHGYGKSE